jgi:hypothetical protein
MLVMGGKITYFKENYFGVKAKKKRWIGVCIKTSLLAKDDDLRCFVFHTWRIKPTYVELALVQ